MDPGLVAELKALANLSPRRIVIVLASETPRHYDLTKGLVDVLFNLCVVQSIETSEELKPVFENHQDVIGPLLSRKLSLGSKNKLLQRNVKLVLALVQTCLLNA